MELREELQRRVEALKGELEAARKRAVQAKAEEETLSNDLAAYQRILEAEARRNGHHVQFASATSFDSMSKPLLNVDRQADGSDVNKARLMREAVLQNRMNGSTAASVQEILKRQGVDCAMTYVYGAISRMKKNGLLLRRRGKWFPSESLINEDTTKQTASESAS